MTKEANIFYTVLRVICHGLEVLIAAFQFLTDTIRKTILYLYNQLADTPISITQSILGGANIGTGAGGSTSFDLKKERNSLQAAPSLVKRFLFLFNEEMKHFTFSGIYFLAFSRNISAENFPFFGLFGTHSSKMVYSGTIRDSRPTTAFRPDCANSQAYFFDSRKSGTIKKEFPPPSNNFDSSIAVLRPQR